MCLAGAYIQHDSLCHFNNNKIIFLKYIYFFTVSHFHEKARKPSVAGLMIQNEK